MLQSKTGTVGDPKMEAEYLASRILHGNINEPGYLNLRMNLAALSFVEASQRLVDLLASIQKMVVGTQDLIDRPIVKKYYRAEASDLKALVDAALIEATHLFQVYQIAIPEKQIEISSGMERDLNSSPQTYEDIGQRVNKYNGEKEHLQQLGQTGTELLQLKGKLEAISREYSPNNPKVNNKEIPAKLGIPYKLYLQQLSTDMDKATDNIQISMNVYKCLDAIKSTTPKDDLDPYLTDVCNNVIEVLTDPENFYSKCKNGGIISSAVGQMFYHCYPEFYMKYIDMYMDNIDKLDHQEVLDFRKCFGLDADNSQLTALCSQYVTLGFTHK